MNRALLCVGLCLMVGALTGCAHMDSVSTTSIPSERGTPVKVEASRFVFLYLNFDNDYINEMTEELARKCPNGRVEGILTKMETVTYFPIFAHSIKVYADGYCVTSMAAAPPAAPKPPPAAPAPADDTGSGGGDTFREEAP